jgi:hypothetical protein
MYCYRWLFVEHHEMWIFLISTVACLDFKLIEPPQAAEIIEDDTAFVDEDTGWDDSGFIPEPEKVQEICNGLDDNQNGLVDEDVLCSYTLYGEDLSNGVLVEDDLRVRLNGEIIFEEIDGIPGTTEPITFQAMPGDELTLEAINSGGGCQNLGAVWLKHRVSGDVAQIVNASPIDEDCDVPPSSHPFYEANVAINF